MVGIFVWFFDWLFWGFWVFLLWLLLGFYVCLFGGLEFLGFFFCGFVVFFFFFFERQILFLVLNLDGD